MKKIFFTLLEYRVAREITLRVLGNQAAADVQKEVLNASAFYRFLF